MTPSRETIVDVLRDIFRKSGDAEYLGEPVTMAQHMLQAAHLAEKAGQDEDVIVAALLHDIGHFTSEFGTFTMADTEDRHHEDAGAEVLGAFFPEIVITCVRAHVAAKRYLCATDPAYFAQLSDASVHSLNLQGGPMDDAEVADFASTPGLDAVLAVRRYDDGGKDPDMRTPGFDHYAPMIQRVVDRHLGVH